jgi:hypothetical protein
MARPLRSWFSPTPSRRVLQRGRASARIEPLEDRRLFASNLISVDTTGLAGANGDTTDPDISSTGRFIVFTSNATNLDSKDATTTSDIYWRDQ